MKQLKLIIAALFLISPFAANADPIIPADPIVVGPGEHLDVDFVTGDIILEEGASLTVLPGADIGHVTAKFLTDVDVIGGRVESINQWPDGRKTIHISGGEVGGGVLELSDMIISGGTFTGNLLIQDVPVFGPGEISGGHFVGSGSGSCGVTFQLDPLVTISGGIFDTALCVSTLQPNLTEGVFSYGLIIEGFGLQLTPFSDGSLNLTGRLRNGDPIDTNIFGLRNYDFLPTFSGGVNEIKLVEVPEPGTLALLGIGLARMGLSRRRRKA